MAFNKLVLIYGVFGFVLITGLIFSMISPEKTDDPTTSLQPMTAADTTNFLHPEMGSLPSGIEDQIKILEKKLAEKPNDWPHVRMLAGLYTTINQKKSAELYQVLKSNNQLTADDWVEFGQLFSNSGKMDSTLFCNQEALKSDPENPKALYNLGAISANSCRYDEAMAFWKKVDLDKADSEVKRLVTNGVNQLSRVK